MVDSSRHGNGIAYGECEKRRWDWFGQGLRSCPERGKIILGVVGVD